MAPVLLLERVHGDLALLYFTDEERVWLEVHPAACIPESAGSHGADALVHLHVAGARLPGPYAAGRTLAESSSTAALRLVGQDVQRSAGATRVETHLSGTAGLLIRHVATLREGERAVRIETRVENTGAEPVRLELLTSFCISGIATSRRSAPRIDEAGLWLHRLRGAWSAEARLESTPIESIHLERPWAPIAAVTERFGQVGTLPCNGFAPFVAVEDRSEGVLWGAALAWPGSWQMELSLRRDALRIAGGLADREFGHWVRTLAPSESIEAPAAIVTACAGDLDDLCDRLTQTQQRAVRQAPAAEHDLPVVFNDWCTNWGQPTHERVVSLADRLAGSGVRYLVIDAGWYCDPGRDWTYTHGDWEPSVVRFPDGLAATADAIRARGLVPGLWFEFETVGEASRAYEAMASKCLHRDGRPLDVAERRFLDLRDPSVVEYLDQRVAGRLESCGFGYLKIDYNESVGLGCDGATSLGAGLEQQVRASLQYLHRLRERLPDLVIENCASGGFRLEPAMQGICSVGSGTDAFEQPVVPILAANLLRVVLPRQLGLWAVLRVTDDEQRLHYKLAATFAGRMHLSGDVDRLAGPRWSVVMHALAFQRACVPILRDAVVRRFGPTVRSYREPLGWQALRLDARDGSACLVVLHRFGGELEEEVEVPLGDAAKLAVVGRFPDDSSAAFRIESGKLRARLPEPFSAIAIRLAAE